MSAMKDCDCNDFLSRLFALFDSELEAAEAEVLRAHVARCPDCTRHAEAEEHIRAILRRSCIEHAPEALRMRVHAQLTVLRLGGGPPAIRPRTSQ
ncbi:MAG TPA: mycothiol system anti-sigma-R factor [Actinomycetales bacterium]|nr:mycothiol system anti-sigma-R factor [Actinomycetales bacterium]